MGSEEGAKEESKESDMKEDEEDMLILIRCRRIMRRSRKRSRTRSRCRMGRVRGTSTGRRLSRSRGGT